jgi:hypothetical protein
MNRRLGPVVLGVMALAGGWQFFSAASSGQTAQSIARLLTGVVRSASGEAPQGVTVSAVQLGVVYWNGSRAARMVVRTQGEVDALRRQTQSAK